MNKKQLKLRAFFNAWRKRKKLDVQRNIDLIKAVSYKIFEELGAEPYRRKKDKVIGVALSLTGVLILRFNWHWSDPHATFLNIIQMQRMASN